MSKSLHSTFYIYPPQQDRLAQICIQQQYFFPDLCKGNCKVQRDSGLSFILCAAGHNNHFFAATAELQICTQ